MENGIAGGSLFAKGLPPHPFSKTPNSCDVAPGWNPHRGRTRNTEWSRRIQEAHTMQGKEEIPVISEDGVTNIMTVYPASSGNADTVLLCMRPWE